MPGGVSIIVPKPILPLTDPNIHDAIDATNEMLTQAGYSESIYVFNGGNPLYTYNGETFILVDTSIAREIRLVRSTGMKFNLTIIDMFGTGADVNPITISVFDSAAAPEFGGGVKIIGAKRGRIDLVSDGDTWWQAPAAGSLGKRIFPAMLFFPSVLRYPVTIGAVQTGLAMDYTIVPPGSLTITGGGILVTA